MPGWSPQWLRSSHRWVWTRRGHTDAGTSDPEPYTSHSSVLGTGARRARPCFHVRRWETPGRASFTQCREGAPAHPRPPKIHLADELTNPGSWEAFPGPLVLHRAPARLLLKTILALASFYWIYSLRDVCHRLDPSERQNIDLQVFWAKHYINSKEDARREKNKSAIPSCSPSMWR